MTLSTFALNGETIAPITLFGRNRHPEVLEWHQRVMRQHFQIPINYLEAPFPQCSHGSVMNHVLASTVDDPNAPSFYWFIDNDAILLRRSALNEMMDKVRDKRTIYSQAWQSNHKLGPNLTAFHPYASQAFLLFSRELYSLVGRPDMDHHHSWSDTAESFTYAVKMQGYTVCLVYPSSSETADTPLDNGCRYGLSNVYGHNVSYHCSQANHPRHIELFIAKCKEVLGGNFGE